MSILSELEDYLKEFDFDLKIDTLRIDFIKTNKKDKLDLIGSWKKINNPNHYLMLKLKRRYTNEEITTVHQLENYNIYYYNSRKKDYKFATMVIFGLSQYHKEPPPQQIVNQILSILKGVHSVDVCYDLKELPNFEAIKEFFYLQRYKKQDTYYINDTNILMMDKICIYNKALKNALDGILWRIEATISIPNHKFLSLPLYEFIQIINLANGNFYEFRTNQLKKVING